ncbi:hypothetical protein [Halorubrum ezzemoulense]|nr:hypothetical protein [Halorubrum ezzemoulense]
MSTESAVARTCERPSAAAAKPARTREAAGRRGGAGAGASAEAGEV